MWANPAGHVASSRGAAGRRGDPHHHAVEQVPQRRLGRRRSTSRSAATAAMRAARRSCPTCTSSCRSTRNGRSASASTRRSGSSPSTTTAGSAATRRSSREVKTINVQSGAVVEGRRRTSRSALGVNCQRLEATLTNNVNYSAAIAQAAQQAAAAGQIPASAGADDHRGDAGPRFVRHGRRRRRRVGLEHRRAVGHQPEHCASARSIARRSSTTCGQRRASTIPTLPTLPPALAPVVSALANGVNSQALFNGGVTADIKLPAIVNLSFFYRLNDRWDIMARRAVDAAGRRSRT